MKMNESDRDVIYSNLMQFAEEMSERECCIENYPQQYRDGFCDHCRAERAMKGTLREYWDWRKGV